MPPYCSIFCQTGKWIASNHNKSIFQSFFIYEMVLKIYPNLDLQPVLIYCQVNRDDFVSRYKMMQWGRWQTLNALGLNPSLKPEDDGKTGDEDRATGLEEDSKGDRAS